MFQGWQYRTASHVPWIQVKCAPDTRVHCKVLSLNGYRWCIKEAAYKALFPVHKLEWKQVTVAKDQGM